MMLGRAKTDNITKHFDSIQFVDTINSWDFFFFFISINLKKNIF